MRTIVLSVPDSLDDLMRRSPVAAAGGEIDDQARAEFIAGILVAAFTKMNETRLADELAEAYDHHLTVDGVRIQ